MSFDSQWSFLPNTDVMRISFVFFFLCLLQFPLHSYAQNAPTDTAYHPALCPNLTISRRVGTITIDGDLTDSGWVHAAHTNIFTGCVPHPMTRPPVATEAYVTYDDQYLYVAMVAHDPRPEQIRNSMIGRDNIFSDDFMGIILDTYGDATRAFEIYLNPRGVQGDLFWTGTNEDQTYDLLYDGESKITLDGWQMEMRIPFASLRFPKSLVQNFHIAFWRNYPRDVVYKMSSCPIDFRLPCAFCQLGSLTGIENIPHSNSFEFLPSLAATESASSPDSALTHPLKNAPLMLKPSLGFRYGLGPASSVEATINPDFSQVEADAAQVSVNTTFALLYPEHRPFFQDGNDLLTTYLPAVYTRSIDDPLAAVKLLHRDPTLSIGYLGGYDEHSPVIIPLEEKSIVVPDAGRSMSDILRIAKTLGTDTYIGVLATDRRYQDIGSNSVVGVDGRVRLFENVALYGQGLWSQTQESNARDVNNDTDLFSNEQHTVAFDGEHFSGTAAYVALERLTQSIDGHIEYTEISPSFRAGNGFIFNNDVQSAVAWTAYKLPLLDPPDWLRWLIEADGTVTGTYNWNFNNVTKLKSVKPQISLSLTGQSYLQCIYRLYTEQFHGIVFPGLKQWNVSAGTSFDSHVSLNAAITVGGNIARTADVPFAGNGIDISASATLKPFSGFLIEPSYLFSELSDVNRSVFYSGSIYRSQFTYQFSRELNARIIVQYDGFAQQLEIDPLITYNVNPFTSFYIGSTHNFASSVDSPNTLRPSERQLFAKVQYLIEG